MELPHSLVQLDELLLIVGSLDVLLAQELQGDLTGDQRGVAELVIQEVPGLGWGGA